MAIQTSKKYGVWINGSSGRMGLEIQKILLEDAERFRLVGGNSRKFEGAQFSQGKIVTKELLLQTLSKVDVDVIFDFSTLEGNELLLDVFTDSQQEATENKHNLRGTAVVLGTTGLAQSTLGRWRNVAAALDLSLLVAPNTSIGILLTVKAALLAAGITHQMGFDIEIIETHHRLKLDAPSGTARFIAETLVDQVDGLSLCLNRQAARQVGEVGVHAVRGGAIFGEHEVRIIGDSEEIAISHRAFSRALFAKGALVLAEWLVKQKKGVYSLLDIDVKDLLRR